MSSVSDQHVDSWLDNTIETWDTEGRLGAHYLAFARTIVDRPDTFEKIANSFSGHALNIQGIAIRRELLLWCCRLWEKNGNSLPNFRIRVSQLSSEIEQSRRHAHPNWTEKQLGLDKFRLEIVDFSEKVNEVSQSDLIARLRVRRDENFSHLLAPGSAGSRKLIEAMGVEEGYTYNEVFQLCETTLGLLATGRYLVWFDVINYIATLENMKRHYERFWRLLPNFADLEKQVVENKINTNFL